MENCRYSLVLLNLGAVLNPFLDISIGHQIGGILNAINANSLLRSCGLNDADFWVYKGFTRSQLLFVAECDTAAFPLEKLYELIKKSAEGYTITLCCSAAPCKLSDLRSSAQKLVSTLTQNVSLGNDQIILGESQKTVQSVLTRDLLNTITGCIRINRYDIVKENLSSLLSAWQNRYCPQFQLESELHQLIHTIFMCSNSDENENLYMTEHFAFSAICNAKQPFDALDDIWTVFDDLILHENENNVYASRTIDDIVAYLESHLSEEITVDSIAEKMGFNAIHLNRVFKKHKRIPMIQYLTNLRIEKAKHLMNTHPEWPLVVIGESVGYPDPHYFSRVFKKCTGFPPSEWRSSQE